jgi:D-amino peptidase
VGGKAADSLHPSRARDLIREASAGVVRRASEDGGTFRPLTLEPPIRVAVDFTTAAQADYAALVPGARREGDRGVVFEAADGVEAYRAFVVLVRLAGLVT